MLVGGYPLRYARSRTVSATTKMGGFTDTGHSKSSSIGFHCYPPPNFEQCNLPPLLDVDEKHFTITGVVQDGPRAKVNILIPWKLTQFAKELQPYAQKVKEDSEKLGMEAPYNLYPTLYGWAHFLNSHGASGASSATILFQKFDDGWRIVNEQGKSERDVYAQ